MLERKPSIIDLLVTPILEQAMPKKQSPTPNNDAEVIGGLCGLIWSLVVTAGVAIQQTRSGISKEVAVDIFDKGEKIGELVSTRLSELKVDEWSKT